MSPTTSPRVLSPAFRILVALSAALAFLVVTGPAATAGECVEREAVQNPDGSVGYKCTKWSGGGEPGEKGSQGGQTEPACGLVAPATFCMGETPCYYKENVVPYAPPRSKPPKKGSDWRVRMCISPLTGGFLGEAVWLDENEPQPPSLQEQAQTAFGQLQVPGATLTFNPTTRTLVSLDTWFWAQGLASGDITGSSAFGLVAIATPDHLELTPGDGSGSMNCDWVTTKSDTCSYAYPRSSAGNGTTTVDGQGAYAANGQAVWDVAFEMNGNPVNIPGAPTELRGPQMNAAVRVVESQSLVTNVG